MRFSALFGEGVWQTALSSLQHLKGYFSGASLPGFLTFLAKNTERIQETGLIVFHTYPGQEYQAICSCHC